MFFLIKNIYSNATYNITSFGADDREVHKHVLYDVISQNECILKIYYKKRCVFDDEIGFISKK